MLTRPQQAVAAASHVDRRLAEAGVSPDAEFRERLDRHFPRLFEHFTDVYGDRPDCLEQLAALVVAIASINAFNRLNAATRQMTGRWVAKFVETAQAA